MEDKTLPENEDENPELSFEESLSRGAEDKELFTKLLQRLITGLELTKEKYNLELNTYKSEKSIYIVNELISRIDTMSSISVRLKDKIDSVILYYVRSIEEIPEAERPSHNEFAEKLEVFNAPAVLYPVVKDLAKSLVEGFEYLYSLGIENPLDTTKEETFDLSKRENPILIEWINTIQQYYPVFDRLLKQFDIQLADSESKFSAFNDWINSLFDPNE
jgi:hypothetical protein